MNEKITFWGSCIIFFITMLLSNCKKNVATSAVPVSITVSDSSKKKMYQYLNAKKSSSRPFIAFVGNSITHGLTASTQDNSFVSVLMRDIQDQEGTLHEQTITTDFTDSDNLEGIDNIICSSNVNISSGPINKSMRLNNNCAVYFHGVIDYLDVWIGENSSIGSQLQFFKDDVLYRTITINNSQMYSTYSGVTTMGNNTIEAPSKVHNYNIKAVGDNVNIYALIRNRYKLFDNLHRPFTFIREAASGWIIPYFLPVLNTITAMTGDTLAQKGIFFIMVSINDMIATTPTDYETNLTTLLKGILSAGHSAIQVFPTKISGHPLYDTFQTIAKNVCSKLQVPFISLADIDFLGNGWLSDGVHPTDIGHRYLAYSIENALANL